MKVGDIVTETPTFYSKAGLDYVGPQRCEVVYIHPKRRFYRVRFRAEITGETWTECKYFPDRSGEAEQSQAKLPCRSGGWHRSAMPGTSPSDMKLY